MIFNFTIGPWWRHRELHPDLHLAEVLFSYCHYAPNRLLIFSNNITSSSVIQVKSASMCPAHFKISSSSFSESSTFIYVFPPRDTFYEPIPMSFWFRFFSAFPLAFLVMASFAARSNISKHGVVLALGTSFSIYRNILHVDPERIALSSSGCRPEVLLLNYEPFNILSGWGELNSHYTVPGRGCHHNTSPRYL